MKHSDTGTFTAPGLSDEQKAKVLEGFIESMDPGVRKIFDRIRERVPDYNPTCGAPIEFNDSEKRAWEAAIDGPEGIEERMFIVTSVFQRASDLSGVFTAGMTLRDDLNAGGPATALMGRLAMDVKGFSFDGLSNEEDRFVKVFLFTGVGVILQQARQTMQSLGSLTGADCANPGLAALRALLG